MRLLIDTNVFLDVLLNRKDFVDTSKSVLEKAIKEGDNLYLSSSAVTDIYYVIRKQTKSRELALTGIKKLFRIVRFAEVNEKCILYAALSGVNDYEDAVVDQVALNINADYIITRNIKHFKNAHNLILSPQDYLDLRAKMELYKKDRE